MLQQRARAKINLALHVTGQRPDGYHELDTIVTFADMCDTLTFRPARGLELTLSGRFGDDLSQTGQNIIIRAAQALRDGFGRPQDGVNINLEKNLPIASGIGGGSSDAAAALRGLCTLWQLTPSEQELVDLALSLGADVPMCLAQSSAHITGIGEHIQPLAISPMNIVLANPGAAVATPSVFKHLSNKNNPALTSPDHPIEDWFTYLSAQRNDLQLPAVELCDAIQPCLDALGECHGNRLVRMSGSGATCFALFDDRITAEQAANGLQDAFPDWWVVATSTCG